ncbi:MAG: hypothetical protein IKK66_02845 [Ruminococcus sp.]|nr:hypothetical protein [Ruminococcus sp.]
MALNVFYSMVRESAEQLIRREPKIAFSANAQICAILTKDHDIISGMSSIYMINDSVGIIPAEYMAVVAMNNAGISRALQMITLSLTDFSVVTPNPSELLLVQSLHPSNEKCNVYISPSDHVAITKLTEGADTGYEEYVQEEQYTPEYTAPSANQGFVSADNSLPDLTPPDYSSANQSPVDFFGDFGETSQKTAAPQNTMSSQSMSGLFSGFGDDTRADSSVPDANELEKMGFIKNSAPGEISSDYKKTATIHNEADFASKFNIDENNPFLDNSGSSARNNDVVYFAEMPQDDKADDYDNDNNLGAQGNAAAAQNLSMDDLLKQAKQKKKIARANFNIRRK